VVLDALAQTGQGASEGGQALELVLCGMGRPVGMIAVLLAPARIAPRRLNMAGGARTDPDIGPGRRDGQAADAVQRGGVPDQVAVRIPIAEAATGATARQAGAVVIAPGQPFGRGGIGRRHAPTFTLPRPCRPPTARRARAASRGAWSSSGGAGRSIIVALLKRHIATAAASRGSFTGAPMA